MIINIIKKYKHWILLIPAFLPGVSVIGIGFWEALKASFGWIPVLGLKTVTFEAYAKILKNSALRYDLVYTLSFACIAAVLSVLIGSLVAWGLVSTMNKFLKKWGSLWLIMAVILPYGVAAMATQAFWGQSGFLARLAYNLGFLDTPSQFPTMLFTPFGVGLFWPYIWKGSAFTAMVLRPYYEKVRNRQDAEARTLGAGGFLLWLAIYIPAGALAMGFIGSVLFAYVFGGLEIPIWLGALNPRLMAANYYSLFLQPDLYRIPERMALVLLMGVTGFLTSVGFGVLVYKFSKRGFGYRRIVRLLKWKDSKKPFAKSNPNSRAFKFEWLIGLYGLLMGVPFIWLLITGQNPDLLFPSIIPLHFKLIQGLLPLFEDALVGTALIKGLTVALLTGLYTALVSLPAGRAFARYSGFRGEKWAQLFSGLPLILPGIVLVTGAQLTSMRFGFYGTIAAVVLCHTTFTIPYAIGIQAIYQKQNGLLQEEAARTLGATPYLYVLKVLIPMNIPPIVISFTLGFLISFTETFSTQLVGAGRVTTLGALLGPALEYGDLARGSGYMILFMILNGAVFYLSYRMTKRMVDKSDHRSMEAF